MELFFLLLLLSYSLSFDYTKRLSLLMQEYCVFTITLEVLILLLQCFFFW